jgi:hypothetical protein
MASKISAPTNVKSSGISFTSTAGNISNPFAVNTDNATPLAPGRTTLRGQASNSSPFVITSPPRAPDGSRQTRGGGLGNVYRPVQTAPRYSAELINQITNNGLDTSSILNNGLNAAIQDAINQSSGTTSAGGLTPQSQALLAGGGAAGPTAGNVNNPPVTLNPEASGGGGGGGGFGLAAAGPPVPPAIAATDNVKLIGQQLWEYPIKLFNHTREFDIPAHAVIQLCIEDDFLSWPLRGYVIVDSKMEGFERNKDPDACYLIRSDARDEIKVDLRPVIEKGELPDELWRIELEGVVYDVEDIYVANMTGKLKKLYFWDKKFQYLLERNLQWSTATGKRYTQYTNNPPCPKPVAHATDLQRSMFTGEAIASLLCEAGYEKYIDFDKWDFGKGRINFVAKADWSVWDCIQYILEQQISSDGTNDICILQWNRGDKKWNMLPMWRLFDLAGNSAPKELQVEHMFIEENVGEADPILSPYKAPYSNDESVLIDVKSDDYNRIKTYKFSQTSGLDNSKAFLSKPVYSHWHRKKQFDTDAKENEIAYVKEEYFKKNYVEKLLSPGKYPVMTMNQSKELQKSIDPQFSVISTIEPENDRVIRSLDGRGKILYAGLFLNQNMMITQPGSTHRNAGTFIGVDRTSTDSDTLFDWQLCGQYFVTHVVHKIQHQKYNNDITMIKVHAYDDLQINEDIE